MTVEEYVNHLDPRQQAEYKRVQGLVKRQVPDAEEKISYGIIGWRNKNGIIIWFGGFKDHMSLYPGAPEFMRDQLEGHKLAKGTIQYTYDKPLTDEFITSFIAWRLEENSKRRTK